MDDAFVWFCVQMEKRNYIYSYARLTMMSDNDGRMTKMRLCSASEKTDLSNATRGCGDVVWRLLCRVVSGGGEVRSMWIVNDQDLNNAHLPPNNSLISIHTEYSAIKRKTRKSK